ncbi:N-acetylmuramic acid 6-phosphate etherase [Abyssisolibacter fermentans]|uniref:N-acetylmuramic acid 6-phosphate etherase n=1 Tax=Abyssisolibacter fermentans TaxID=1766203 RepID=UPI00083248E8|nr:N-acetylmuramic acid 6-phosphate etherase [Abyssisolibacter fermentans]
MKIDLSNLTTERRNPNTFGIDIAPTQDMIKMINEEDKKVAFAVEKEIPNIAKAVDLIAEAFEKGGRLIYIGAGTSGRLGILDASECPPTFGTPKEMVQGIIAGGYEAIFSAVEGAEDNKLDGIEELKKINFSNKDVLVGITASGRTPYVIGAINYANEIGSVTIAVTNNVDSAIQKIAKVCIAVVVGSEALTGSTRLKAGTAQKMVLNILTTGSMIKLGKVYENLMVDVQSTNLKLVERCKNIVMEATSVDKNIATQYLEETDYDVKFAIFMIKSKLDKKTAKEVFESYKGHIREALKAIEKQ